MSFWKKLGKIAAFAAPIVAAPFTGGASLALIGAGAGAANAAMDHKGLGGILAGAGLGAIPGVGKAATASRAMSGITKAAIQGGLGAAGGAATGGEKGALIGGLMGAASSKLGGGGSGNAVNGNVTSRILNAGKDALLGNGQQGGLMQQLLSGQTLQAAGQGLGAVGQTQAHNRGVKLSAMMDADKMRMLNDQDRRAAESDILRKLHTAEYIKSGGIGANDKPIMSAAGHALPKFDFGVRPSSDIEKQAASTLESQLMDRLNNPAKLADYSKQMDPSKMENFLNWTSPVLTTLAAAKGVGNYQQPQAAKAPVPGQLPTPTPYTFGQALPTEAPPVVPGQLTQFGTTLDNSY